MILRLAADSRATLDALLGRQLRGGGRDGADAGCPFILVVRLQSVPAAERFLGSNAARIEDVIGRPVLFVEVEHSTSAVLPPFFVWGGAPAWSEQDANAQG